MKLFFCFIAALTVFPLFAETPATSSYYLSLGGVEPKYKAGFKHLDYVNPEAPKGGKVTFSALGSFDSFNPFPIKGTSFPVHHTTLMHLMYESLMDEPLDDNLVNYCFLAESVKHPDDNSYVTFTLRKDIKFNDGTIANADDLLFSFNMLREKGKPFYRTYYADVLEAQKLDNWSVKFVFKNNKNKELALILGQLPVLSKAFWSKHKFDDTILEPIVTTGPYMVSKFKPGHEITLKLNPDYWAKDHPLAKGRWNYDKIKFQYYKDSTLTLQAFIAGETDIKLEVKPDEWFKDYNGPTFKSGYNVKQEIHHETPPGRMGYYFNLRKPIFQDSKVREALTYLYNFEWVNKNLFRDKFQRTKSYFQNTELAATGLPTGEELEILEEYENDLPIRVFKEAYTPPKTDGSGNIRSSLRIALRLFKEAGWITQGDKLINKKTKEPFTFEILIYDPYHQRYTQPFINNLAKAGIEAKFRIVDSAQYEMRENNFDFDMIVSSMGITFSPGNEQEAYWGSKFADRKGGQNKTGLKNKVVDELIQKIINTQTRKDLIIISKAFDRVLQWLFVSIPLFYNPNYWVAHKDKFGKPKNPAKMSLGIYDTWWVDPLKDKALDAKKP
ncbi:MAG: extracellular solute-binding protein [Alphaproteobacteria bacterium]|nr:extracellular solute-binding protein [Alphaproteobacteria bacterium]